MNSPLPPTALTLSSIASLFIAAMPAHAQLVPDGTLNTSIETANSTVDRITGGTRNNSSLFHSFRDFNVNPDQSVYFDNPIGVTNIFTRITGTNRSNILGTLGVNGSANLLLLNPNGFFFGSNAKLDLAGSFRAIASDRIIFNTNNEFSVTTPPAELLTLNITPGLQYGQPKGAIANNANLLLKSNQTLTFLGDTVWQQGVINVPTGEVQLLGDRVALMDNSQINTSSPASGGNIFIGGSYQGKGELPNATAVYIAPSAIVQANATTNGNGGQIIVWSENSTRAYGNFSAQGGTIAGNGGLIETSSRSILDTTGIIINTTAPNGIPGTWLLDPRNITLRYSGAWKDKFQGDTTKIFTPTETDSVVNIAAIEQFLNEGNNVTIRTSDNGNEAGNITTDTTGFGLEKKTGTPVTLTFQAHNDIRLGSIANKEGFGIKDLTPNGNSLNVILEADIDRDGRGNIIVEQGGFILAGGQFQATASQRIALTQTGIKSRNTTNQPAAPIGLTAPEIEIREGGITSSTITAASSANIVIQTADLSLQNAGLNSTTGAAGKAGDILIGRQITPQGTIAQPSRRSTIAESGITTATGLVVAEADITINGVKVDQGDLPKTEIPINGQTTAVGINERPDLAVFRPFLRPNATGTSGNIVIFSDEINLSNKSGINNNSFSQGNAGVIDIQSPKITVKNSSGIDGRTAVSGRGADIQINALNGDILIQQDAGINSRSYGLSLAAPTVATARSGNVTIQGRTLTLIQGAGIDTNAGYSDINTQRQFYPNSRSGAGDITVTVDQLNATGGSGLRSETAGLGNAGQITLTVRDQARLINNANISTGTFKDSAGNSGNITANIGTLFIGNDRGYKPDRRNASDDPTGRAGGISSATLGTGPAGNINLTVRDSLTIDNAPKNRNRDRAGIRLFSEQDNQGGSLRLQADRVTLKNAFISAEAKSADGGNVNANISGFLLLRDNSQISATAGDRQNPGNGGNIEITTPLIIAIPKENSDITANAFSGNGGLVTLNADNLIGIQFRPQITPLSDITASSERGNQGTVTLNTPELDPNRGLVPLPNVLADPSNQIDQSCSSSTVTSARFVVTGDGLPNGPDSTQSTGPIARLAKLPPESLTVTPRTLPNAAAIIEAQTAQRQRNGQISLRQQTAHHPHLSALNCRPRL